MHVCTHNSVTRCMEGKGEALLLTATAGLVCGVVVEWWEAQFSRDL